LDSLGDIDAVIADTVVRGQYFNLSTRCANAAMVLIQANTVHTTTRQIVFIKNSYIVRVSRTQRLYSSKNRLSAEMLESSRASAAQPNNEDSESN
jgi:ABC-type transporter Mla maintaining outer membrane lipid asymmetry ATPase subunit MlaF